MIKSTTKRSAISAAVLLVLLAAILVPIAYWQQWSLGPQDRIFLETQDASGMTEGMRVMTRGVVVGRVRSIALTPAGQSAVHGVRIELGIGRRHMEGIPKGSTAVLVRQNLVGRQVIDLVPPSSGAPPVSAGDQLAFERGKDIDRIVQDIHAELQPVIDDARKLVQSLNDPAGSFQQALQSGQEVAARMPALVERTGEAIDQAKASAKTIEGGAKATLQSANRTIEFVEQSAPAVIEKVQQAAANAQQASTEVQAIATRASERLPQVLDQVQAAATQTNQMVSNARQTWPISLLTGTATTPQSLPIDSVGGLPLPGEAP
ncbi:MlaD family protein [Variovorax sp. OV329]|uniref:MlaD family protein n=1 Tax=Variovorax sp. OV329 TaxID=1882825 RepID=UPI0008F031AF|nr:MlaD family protein [Variovorax sp. OV329]SFN51032.1 ABC-type transporter Mla maintaining outer membrane lipid asymmetry, component MlaD [Variovorax sp. OV329]